MKSNALLLVNSEVSDKLRVMRDKILRLQLNLTLTLFGQPTRGCYRMTTREQVEVKYSNYPTQRSSFHIQLQNQSLTEYSQSPAYLLNNQNFWSFFFNEKSGRKNKIEREMFPPKVVLINNLLINYSIQVVCIYNSSQSFYENEDLSTPCGRSR